MTPRPEPNPLASNFLSLYGQIPTVIASAPGRLEVLGNHTDYNRGLTLSCAVGFRCYAAISGLDEPVVKLASTAFGGQAQTIPLQVPMPFAPKGHWANYILGLVVALQERGHSVPGFALLVDSQVPRSAGVSSSAALEMAVLTGLLELMQLKLPPIEMARIGQWAESRVVGAKTGLLDQLTALCGKRDHFLHIDFQSLKHRAIPLPLGWAFVLIDSGVKHDLTGDYSDRRASCEAAAQVMGIPSLRRATQEKLDVARHRMPDQAFDCTTHILHENQRVYEATVALDNEEITRLGQLMFESHDSSRDFFRNSCPEPDQLIVLARQDPRCIGARLCGGGFGGISIHLVREENANEYRDHLVLQTPLQDDTPRWSAIAQIDDGATVDSPPSQ